MPDNINLTCKIYILICSHFIIWYTAAHTLYQNSISMRTIFKFANKTVNRLSIFILDKYLLGTLLNIFLSLGLQTPFRPNALIFQTGKKFTNNYYRKIARYYYKLFVYEPAPYSILFN